MPSLSTGRPSVDMETPRHSISSTSFREAEVLYLLSRGAQLEQPHMVNVYYAAHQPGPTLGDVKDRLIAVRGKGMPDLFSWSYKRNYKDTFIWCDLFDGDFIFPLADSGEYVLKAVELFDASQDASDEEIEYHSARESLPVIRSTPRLSSLSKSSRPSTGRDRLTLARKESLLLNDNAGDVASGISMDLSKHGSGTYPSFEDIVVNEKYIPEVQGPRSIAARTNRLVALKRCKSSPHSAYRESLLQRDGTTDRKESAVDKTPTTAKRNDLVSVFSLTPASTPRAVPGRRTWEKEIDKITIYTDLNYNKSLDECLSPHFEVPVLDILRESDHAPGSVASEDSFLYLLRKATRLGSFRPRLCRGVDVIDSTRAKTSKMHFRSKTKDEVNKLLFKSSVKQARSSIDGPSRNSATSLAKLVRKTRIRLPEKTIPTSLASEKKNKTFPDEPVDEFKTLAYFESKERNFPALKITSEPHSVGETPKHHLSIAPPESRPHVFATGPQEIDAPQSEFRSSGSDSLDVAYRKTMEVLAQLSTSRRADNTSAVRKTQGATEISEAGASPVTQGEAKKFRSESKGNKQEVKVQTGSPKLCTPPSRQAPIRPSPEDSPKNMSLEQRRLVIKEPPGGAIANSETSAGSHQVEAAAKPSDEEGIETPKSSTKHLSVETVNVASLLERPRSGKFDSRTLHSGNKQGVKTATQVTSKAEAAAAQSTSKLSSNDGTKGWPFKQPARPRDFKSREDRPLIPGLTHMDWEKSFQEAAMHSELIPVDLVLHECSRCGRTFKLDSLQVHMRGCHAVKKSKSSSSTQRKRRSL